MTQDDGNKTESPMEQDDIDNIFGDEKEGKSDGKSGGGGNGMKLGEISEAEEVTRRKTVDQEFGIGEPMANDVTAIYDIPVQISAVLGRSTMQVSQLLKLGRGAVVELDRKVGEAIDIYVNNRLVARGEVVVVEDKLGVTMTEIVKSDRS